MILVVLLVIRYDSLSPPLRVPVRDSDSEFDPLNALNTTINYKVHNKKESSEKKVTVEK
jgi:hypothetical protein